MSSDPQRTGSTRIGEVEVFWVGGGVHLEHEGHGLLLDAPAGVSSRLGARRLASLRSIATTSGRVAAVGGLVELLGAIEPYRAVDLPLSLHVPLGEERAELLANAWVRGWPDRYPLAIETDVPGQAFAEGAFHVRTIPVQHGEPRWRPRPRVESTVGVALRVRVDDVELVWLPGAAPSPAARRACEGADLAIVEIGVTRWPAQQRRWRMDTLGAVQAAQDARSTWLVGDDGQLAGGPDQ